MGLVQRRSWWLVCGLVVLGCVALPGRADVSFHTGPPTPEDLELMKRLQQFQQEYERQKLECAKTGKVALVTPTTPAGDQASFTCVLHDDARYEAQHPTEAEPHATELTPLLEALVGHNVADAVDRLGGPQGEPIIDDEVVYTWGCSTKYTVPGTTLFDEERTKECSIQLFTDRGTRTIKRFAWTEKRGGCQSYAERLAGPRTL
jgi:hypothetical protein